MLIQHRCSVAIAATAGLLATGNQTVMDQGSYSSPYSLGFGAYNQYAVLNLSLGSGKAEFTSTSILMGMVVIANMPQVIVSCLYFTYNTVYTSSKSIFSYSISVLLNKSSTSGSHPKS